jgi:cell division protein FtsB
MNDVVAMFVTIMTAMVLAAALIFGWMRTRAQTRVVAHGLESTRQLELLSNENAGLKGQVSRLEERIAVLERIATDPADRTAREIDQLR